MIQIRSLYKYFENLKVLNGVDLDISEGEVICIIGASGSGKSTLLRCINFLDKKDSGDIYFDGNIVKNDKQDIINLRIFFLVNLSITTSSPTNVPSKIDKTDRVSVFLTPGKNLGTNCITVDMKLAIFSKNDILVSTYLYICLFFKYIHSKILVTYFIVCAIFNNFI